MPIRNVFVCALLLAASLPPLAAQQLIVVPGAASSTTTSSQFTVEPFASSGTINGAPGVFLAFANPEGTRFFLVTASSVVVTDQAGAQVQPPLAIGAPVTSATLTPDGKHLLVVGGNATSGSLFVLDVSGDTASQAGQVTVANNPFDVAVSADSGTAYVVASGNIQKVNLASLAPGDPVALTGVTAQSPATPTVTVGPNGLLYVSAPGSLLELDPTTLRTLNTIPVGGFPGEPSFSSDAKAGAVGNQLSSTGSTALLSVLDLTLHSVTSTLTGLQTRMSRVIYVDAHRVYAIAPGSKVLYLFNPSSPSAILQPSFPSIGKIANATDAVLSNESSPNFMFVSATGRVVRVDLVNTAAAPATAALSTPAGAAFYAPVATAGVPQLVRQFNSTQTLALNAVSLPLLVRVYDSGGHPVANKPVNWTGSSNLHLQGAMTATNSQGVAAAFASAAVAGAYTATVSFPGSSLAAQTFTLNVGGGGGGGGTGGGGTPGISIVSGDGQVQRGGISAFEPLIVAVRDSAGRAVAGATVTWAVTSAVSGQGHLTADFNDENQLDCLATVTDSGISYACPTDANGVSAMSYQGPSSVNSSFVQNTVTASVKASGSLSAGTVTFTETTVPQFILGSTNSVMGPLPSVTAVQPPLGVTVLGPYAAGSTIAGAFQVQVQATNPNRLNVPKVSLLVRDTAAYKPGDMLGAPAVLGGHKQPAYCSGNYVTTNSSGVASCDLVIPADTAAGTYTIYRATGGFDVIVYTLVVTAAPPPVPVPTTISALSGDNQTAEVGQPLPANLVAVVKDQFGTITANQVVAWTVTSGQATLNNPSAKTDASGKVTAGVTLGSTAGTVKIRVTAGNATFTFTATATAHPVVITGFTLVSGNNQSAVTSSAFANPLVVQVNTAAGALPGASVTFTLNGPGSLVGSATQTTNSQGQASISVNAGATAGTVTVTASLTGFAQTVTFTLTVRPPGPQLSLAGIVNGASFEAGNGIALGSIVTILAPGLTTGLNIESGRCITGPVLATQLPTQLAGVQFIFGNLPAPIYAICKNADGTEQANVQAPFELAPANIYFTVRYNAGTASQTDFSINGLPIVVAAPGVFEQTVSGQKIAVAVRPDGSFVAPDNPAHPGEVIRIYVTGLGWTIPSPKTNQLGLPGQVTYSKTTASLGGVNMGGVTGEYAENLIGVYVVTFQIPSNQTADPAAPLSVTMVQSDGSTQASQVSHLPIQ